MLTLEDLYCFDLVSDRDMSCAAIKIRVPLDAMNSELAEEGLAFQEAKSTLLN